LEVKQWKLHKQLGNEEGRRIVKAVGSSLVALFNGRLNKFENLQIEQFGHSSTIESLEVE